MEKLVIALVVLAAFVFVVSLASIHVQEEITSGTACGCSIPVYIIVPLLSSAGLIIGVIVYYYASEHVRDRYEKKDNGKLLKLLSRDEREIIQTLSESKKPITQAKIAEKTGRNKVKVSRVLRDLETKGAVVRKSSGVSNKVTLSPDIEKLLC
jgi:uncharacterized membrane protein